MKTKVEFKDKIHRSWIMYMNDEWIKEFNKAMTDYILSGTTTMFKKEEKNENKDESKSY